MSFKIARELLIRPLEQVAGVVERRQTLPILSNLLFAWNEKELRLTATDLEVEIIAATSANADEPGEATLPARKMLDICRALPEGSQLEIVIEGAQAVIRSAKSRFSLACLPVEDFPNVTEIAQSHSFSAPQALLRTLLEKTHFSMAQQDVRYYLNGLMLELSTGMLRCVATDGHRLALSQAKADVEDIEPHRVIIPRKGVGELRRLLDDSDRPVKCELGSNHIRVSLPEVTLTSKLIDGKFPEYTRVIPKGGDKEVIVNRSSLRGALNRTVILSNEKYRGARFKLEPNGLQIFTHNPDNEEAEEEISVEYQGDNLEIGFNANYISEAIGALSGDNARISLSDGDSSCLIRSPGSDDNQYVVMPMRL